MSHEKLSKESSRLLQEGITEVSLRELIGEVKKLREELERRPLQQPVPYFVPSPYVPVQPQPQYPDWYSPYRLPYIWC